MATLTGRAINILNRWLPGLGRRGMLHQVSQFRASKGRKGGKLMGKPTFVLDVVGRKSGKPHPVMLMLVRRDDDLVVCGSRGGHPELPNWYKNLSAAGEAHVEVGADRWAVDFREVDEGAERDACWKLLVASYPDFASYQELTSRRLPIGVLRRKGS